VRVLWKAYERHLDLSFGVSNRQVIHGLKASNPFPQLCEDDSGLYRERDRQPSSCSNQTLDGAKELVVQIEKEYDQAKRELQSKLGG